MITINNINNAKFTSKILLEKITKGWGKRASVHAKNELNIEYDLKYDDFSADLLPFYHHELYSDLPEDRKTKILSAGWIVYNLKTIAIEMEIVNPLCSLLYKEEIFPIDHLLAEALTETLTDESYHIYLCHYGNQVTKTKRQLDFKVPQFNFVKMMQKHQAKYAHNWQKKLIHLATAIASEIYITDYLGLLKENTNIQPLNQYIVKTHRSDELVHGRIFEYIAKIVFQHLNEKERIFFAKVLPLPLIWLSDSEFEIWAAILKQFSVNKYDKMLLEAKEHAQSEIIVNDGVPDYLKLMSEIGIFDLQEGYDSFKQYGLI